MKIEELKASLAGLEDPRRTDRGNIRHKLEDIIIIGLCTLICDGSDFADMEEFGIQRQMWLRQFLELPNGIPDCDTFRRVFERLDPKSLSKCLHDWLSCNRKEGSVIAVDGKTIRGSGNQSHAAYHVVSAFVAENQITLGEIMTDEKSNEITAVPELLDTLDIQGSIITADAMSCQKKIAKKICDKKADYVLALKENQPNLLQNVSLYFEHFSSELPVYTTSEKDHGRIEKREYRLLYDLSWLPEAQDWSGLSAVGSVTSHVTKEGKTSVETRYYITSLNNLERFAYAVRKHWAIENQLHWSLDVIFDEDSSRARKDNSPLNLNILRKIALALCKNTDLGKRVSTQKKRFRAALNPDVFSDILLGKG
jgi:predicted transposase YbfD/YdcC